MMAADVNILEYVYKTCIMLCIIHVRCKYINCSQDQKILIFYFSVSTPVYSFNYGLHDLTKTKFIIEAKFYTEPFHE